ncbi:hypothetical protein HN51_068111 [Arachis hypogaea]
MQRSRRRSWTLHVLTPLSHLLFATCTKLRSTSLSKYKSAIFSSSVQRIAIGSPGEAAQPDAIRAAFAEFFSLLIFVFAGEVSGMAYNKLTNNGPAIPSGLIAASLSHAFGLIVAVSVGANISGDHVNPAVTFGAFIGGNITLLRSILYWFAQLLGSVLACIHLRSATGGMEPLSSSDY